MPQEVLGLHLKIREPEVLLPLSMFDPKYFSGDFPGFELTAA